MLMNKVIAYRSRALYSAASISNDITTLITTLSIMVVCYAVSFMPTVACAKCRNLALYDECLYAELHYTECRLC